MESSRLGYFVPSQCVKLNIFLFEEPTVAVHVVTDDHLHYHERSKALNLLGAQQLGPAEQRRSAVLWGRSKR
jgi:hypothetical protein